jgi:hypothetical protein
VGFELPGSGADKQVFKRTAMLVELSGIQNDGRKRKIPLVLVHRWKTYVGFL